MVKVRARGRERLGLELGLGLEQGEEIGQWENH